MGFSNLVKTKFKYIMVFIGLLPLIYLISISNFIVYPNFEGLNKYPYILFKDGIEKINLNIDVADVFFRLNGGQFGFNKNRMSVTGFYSRYFINLLINMVLIPFLLGLLATFGCFLSLHILKRFSKSLIYLYLFFLLANLIILGVFTFVIFLKNGINLFMFFPMLFFLIIVGLFVIVIVYMKKYLKLSAYCLKKTSTILLSPYLFLCISIFFTVTLIVVRALFSTQWNIGMLVLNMTHLNNFNNLASGGMAESELIKQILPKNTSNSTKQIESKNLPSIIYTLTMKYSTYYSLFVSDLKPKYFSCNAENINNECDRRDASYLSQSCLNYIENIKSCIDQKQTSPITFKCPNFNTCVELSLSGKPTTKEIIFIILFTLINYIITNICINNIRGVIYSLICSSISNWYISGGKEYPNKTSIVVYLKRILMPFYMLNIIVASLVIMFLDLINLIVQILYMSISNENDVLNFFSLIIKWFVDMALMYFNYISRISYSIMIIKGEDFFTSASEANSLVMSAPFKYSILNNLFDIALFFLFGLVFSIFLAGGVGIFYLYRVFSQMNGSNFISVIPKDGLHPSISEKSTVLEIAFHGYLIMSIFFILYAFERIVGICSNSIIIYHSEDLRNFIHTGKMNGPVKLVKKMQEVSDY